MARIFRLFLAGLTGLVLFFAVAAWPFTVAVATKAVGGNSPCPWGPLLASPWSLARLQELREASASSIRLISEDTGLGIQQYETPSRKLWIQAKGEIMDGPKLMGFILAEQQWLSERTEALGVRSGDVVMDVGAHIGSFADDAMRRGAATIIMLEPDPVNQECIRRNYPQELASGRVVLVPEGAWSSESSLDFHKGVSNSGSGSLVLNEKGAETVKVPVRPIDTIVARLGLKKLDFIKMDIEGAEREALKGAEGTLRRFRPRIMLDAYHLPDDDEVLPKVILAANPAYRMECAACAPSYHNNDNRLTPYALFFY